MRVAKGDVNALVTHPVGDCQRAEPLFDEQGDMAMAQVMNADALDAGRPAAPLYLVVERRLRDFEDALIGAAVVVGELLRNFANKKLRQFHHAC